MKLRININPTIYSYLSKVHSEKVDYSYESFTNTENFSEDSFKATVKVDREKIKQMSIVRLFLNHYSTLLLYLNNLYNLLRTLKRG